MPENQEAMSFIQRMDAIDEYFECVTACSLEEEGVECVTKCVQVHLKGDDE